MKKIFFLLTFIPAIVNANPIWLGVNISEIYFDESGGWTLEIDNVNITSVEFIDSIIIECNSGLAKILEFDTTEYVVITNENLNNFISFNKEHDCIKLYSYAFGDFVIDSICIGEVAGSYLKNIESGQSISRLYGNGSFYKDNTPTIGLANDLDGSKGKIFGYFYNTDGAPIKNKYFFINEGNCTPILQEQGYAGNIVIDETGFYCAEITSRNYTISEREIYESSTNYELMQFQIIKFELNENDSININFFVQAQEYEYIPFPLNSGAVWSEVYTKPLSDETYPSSVFSKYTFFDEDTVVNGITYQKMFTSNVVDITRENSVCTALVREDSTRKVWMRKNTADLEPNVNENGEYLLYDFGLEEGDTINAYEDYFYSMGVPSLLIVDSVRYINIFDKLRKVYYFNIPGEVWIEGVGKTKGVVFPSGDFPTNGMHNELICFHKNDTLLYKNPDYDNCVPDFVQVYKYVPFPTSNAVWSEMYWRPFSQNVNPRWVYNKYALFDEDTVINDLTYHKLYHTHDSEITKENSTFIGGIREDSLKNIYCYFFEYSFAMELPYLYTNEEVKMYDFNIDIGDTIHHLNFALESMYLVVKQIDTILINNTLRKVYSFDPIYWVYWIEGIGSVKGLLFTSGGLPTNAMNNDLICMHQNDTLLYYFSGEENFYDDCVPTAVFDGVSLITIPGLKVFPNPVKEGVVSFENIDYDQLELFDPKGNRISVHNIAGRNSYSINTVGLQPGIYVYKLSTEGIIPVCGKLVVE
ncbi:MAG: T9SS type A sorting domain-containing protein [Prolixibacteraceae bacterium]|nr:T9SS type A sorting domain-containing protein [Prolixibacteraceae bacterium]